MQDLFFRTLAQAIEAFVPVFVWLVWLRCSGQRAQQAAVRLGLLGALLLTPLFGWQFLGTSNGLQWQVVTAIAAACAAMAVTMSLLRPALRGDRLSMAWWIAAAAATAVVVLRQTIVLGAVFGMAAFQVRSLEATEAVTAAVILALIAAASWSAIGKRLSLQPVLSGTRATAVLFLAQVAFCAFHRSAEARFLPQGDMLDAATEAYGPESVFGRSVSVLLAGLPFAAAAFTSIRERCRRAPRVQAASARLRRAAVPLAGVAIIGCTVVIAARALDLGLAHGNAATGPSRELTSIVSAPHVVFLTRVGDGSDGLVSVASLKAPDVARASGALRCERLAFAGRSGICLQAQRGLFTSYQAVLFNESLEPRSSFKLEGTPSRTRISPDGRVGAITMFVAGHSYAGSSFSTKTILVDMASGDVLGDLEQFSTWREGKRFSAPDFNFWGVTFSRNSNIFYASLRTIADVQGPSGQTTRRAQTYLVRGDLGLRKLTVLHENVECPSLSPDDRTIAYKKRVDAGAGPWRFYVLDLATMTERAIGAEARSIDDQIEWLDDDHVLYGTFRSAKPAAFDVYVSPIEGGESARVFLPGAESPIVVR
jgi:hypothetical protein